MSVIALIVRHKAKPGMRDAMRSIWEHFVKPNAANNPEHLAYYFCYDSDDETGITAFQIFSSTRAKDDFLESKWYPEYIEKVSHYIAEPPQITTSSLIWSK